LKKDVEQHQRPRFSGILKETEEGVTNKQLEENHSERSWKKLE
jgi:hypothetical protein